MVAETLVADGISYTIKTVHNLCKSLDFIKVGTR